MGSAFARHQDRVDEANPEPDGKCSGYDLADVRQPVREHDVQDGPGWALIAGTTAGFMIESGGAQHWRVPFFLGIAVAGVAGAASLFFRGPWGALIVVGQVLGLFVFWLIPAGQASASVLIPGGLIATMLLGLAVAWHSRARGI